MYIGSTYRSWGLLGACVVAGAGLLPQAAQGALFDYNVVTTQQLTTSSHIEGTTFTNNLSFQNWPVFANSPLAGTGDTLTVAGTLTPISGSGLTIERGVFRHATAVPGGTGLNLNGGSSSVTDATVSIVPLANEMATASAYYSSLTTNSTVQSSGNDLVFSNTSGNPNGVVVFTVNDSQLSQSNLQIKNSGLATAQLVVINVTSGSGAIVTGGGSNFTSSDVSWSQLAGKVIWNFVDDPQSIKLNTQWYGSILAPDSLVENNYQNINGGLYANSAIITGEVHLTGSAIPFSGPVPEPGSMLLLALGGAGLLRRSRSC